MGISGGNKPLQGDALESAHAAVPAGAIDGELYAAAPTTAPVVSIGAAGVVTLTSAKWNITYAIRNPVTDAILGETAGGTASATLTPDPSSDVVEVTAIPVSPNDHVNCRRIYRDSGGGFRLVGEILDNITTTFSDNVLDTTSQPIMPTTNTTGQSFTANVKRAITAISIKEETTNETLAIRSDGLMMTGGSNLALPFSYSELIGYFMRPIGTATDTVPADEIWAITNVVSDGAVDFLINAGAGALIIAQADSSGLDFVLHQPILVDTTWVLSGSAATSYDISGMRFTRTSLAGGSP